MMHFVGNAAVCAIITALYFCDTLEASVVIAIAMLVYSLANLVILISIIIHVFLTFQLNKSRDK
jgi:hypothetical protein